MDICEIETLAWIFRMGADKAKEDGAFRGNQPFSRFLMRAVVT